DLLRSGLAAALCRPLEPDCSRPYFVSQQRSSKRFVLADADLAVSYDDTNRLVSTAARCNRCTDRWPARQGRRNQERGTCRRKTRPLQPPGQLTLCSSLGGPTSDGTTTTL